MRRIAWAAAGLLLVVTIAATRSFWLPLPGVWLDVSQNPEPADVIFVLSGHSADRARAAARLYHQRYGSQILVTGSKESDVLLLVTGERILDTEIVARMLARLGVPRSATSLVNDVTSTRDDAEAFKAYVRAHSVRSAIVVTSHLHSRRARWTLRHVVNDSSIRLQLVEADQPDFTPGQWWQDEDGLVTVFNEYLKLGFYRLHY